MPLLLAGGVCCAVVDDVVLGAVRALVVLPELPVAGGVEGGAVGVGDSALVPDALDVFPFVSGVLALVVLPEFAAAEGVFFSVPLAAVVVSVDSAAFAPFDFLLLVAFVSAAVVFPEAVSPAEFVPLDAESVAAFFDLDFLLLAVLPSEAAGASPVGGVALAAGSAAALFLVLLFFSGAVLAFVSPTVLSELAVSPAACFDLDLLVFLLDVVPAAPDALVDASVPVVWSAAFFFLLVVVFLAVVDVPSDAVAVESVESAAGFFFFLVVDGESLCV